MKDTKRWMLVYGKKEGLQGKAVELLCEELSGRLPYVLPVRDHSEVTKEDEKKYNFLFLGDRITNEKLGAIVEKYGWEIPSDEQGYRLEVTPEENGKQIMSVIGSSDIGVLHGAADFVNTYLSHEVYKEEKYRFTEDDLYSKTYLEPLRPFSKTSVPSVKERGLWTWGHVIYDYKRFFKNMAKLRLNTIVIWNDHAPLNAKEIVKEAHAYGIKTIWGFSWGWDNDGSVPELTKESAERWAKKALTIYETQYKETGADGIYFQTFTETDEDSARGVRIASAVTEWVNTIAREFYEKYPDLRIQFGLHANSVKNYVDELKKTDERMDIVWENCGSFPFTYFPDDVERHASMQEFLKKIATLRGKDDKFGVVIKSMSLLDWKRFEHIDGAFLSGNASKSKIKENAPRRERIWRFFQSYWIENAEYAYDAIRFMEKEKNGNMSLQALVEDGLFEEGIWFPVALYAAMAWDTTSSAQKIVAEVCKWECVKFANVE